MFPNLSKQKGSCRIACKPFTFFKFKVVIRIKEDNVCNTYSSKVDWYLIAGHSVMRGHKLIDSLAGKQV